MKALIVDDDKTLGKLLQAVLDAEGFETLVAADGREAFDLLQNQTVDCIVSDVVMPHVDGFRLAYKVRRDPRFQNIPFIMYTSSDASMDDEQFALNLGVDRYIRKPGSTKDIIKTIHDLLNEGNGNRKPKEYAVHDKWVLEKCSRLLIDKIDSSLTNFQNAIERSSIVSRTDKNGLITFVNKNFVDISGYSEGELLGQSHQMISSGYHSQSFWSDMWATISNGKTWRGDIKNKAKDGTFYWVDTSITPFMDESGNVFEFLSIRNDITKRKNFELALQGYNERFELASKATNDAIWDWNIIQDVMVWNHGMQSIFGYSEREISATGAWWKKKIAHHDYNRINAELQEAFTKKNNQWTSQYQYRCADGSYKYVLDRAYIIYREDKPIRMIGAMQDITEVVQYRQGLELMVEERTRKLNEALKKEMELVDMKSKFISIASHEFRTPLSTIAITCGLIRKHQKKISPQEIDSRLENVEKQVEHMTFMLDDVLLVEKAEAGKLQILKTEINPHDFFVKLCAEVEKSKGSAHKLCLIDNLSSDTIISDERLLRSIAINLLTNAIKFSPAANRVDVILAGGADQVSLTVKDYGIGIPQEDIKNLFEPFYRGANVTTIQGTGLGLSIIKKSLDLLKGCINILSEVNRGTQITVKLPRSI